MFIKILPFVLITIAIMWSLHSKDELTLKTFAIFGWLIAAILMYIIFDVTSKIQAAKVIYI